MGRLIWCFFPAFIPLLELVPWLLPILGVLTGIAGFSIKSVWHNHKSKILIVVGLSFMSAAGVYAYSIPHKETRITGTREIEVDKWAIAQHNQSSVTVLDTNFKKFGELWSNKLQNQALSSGVVVNELLFYGSFEGSVEALSIKNGETVWSLPQKTSVSSLSADNGSIYAGEGLHHTKVSSLTSIKADTGQVYWQREFIGHIEERPAIDSKNNRLWTGAGPGGLWMLKLDSGDVIWHQSLGHIDSKPFLFNNMIIIPAQIQEDQHNTVLYALDAGTGRIQWQTPLPGQPWGTPISDKSKKIIFSTTGLGQIGITRDTDKGWAQALSPTGRLIWQVELPSMPLQPSHYIPEKDLIIHTLKNGEIFALNAADGTVNWHMDLLDELQAPSTLILGFNKPMIATTSYNGMFSIFNALTGDKLAHRKVGMQSTSSPAIDGDIVYVLSAKSVTAFGGLHTLVEK